MSTPTTDIREIFARIEHGLAGTREAKVMKEYIEHLTYELGYNDDEVWQQCRFCHRFRNDGHDDHCPAQQVA